MNLKFCYLLMLLSTTIYSQVGVGTTAPTSTLDINGNLKIRSVTEETTLSNIKDSILVVSSSYVKSIPATSVIDVALPTTVKGSFSSAGLINLSLLSGTQIIPFDSEDFDTNNEYNTTTYTYTAKQDGIYQIDVQIEANSTIGIATNFGVMILKNGTTISRNSFANIGVLGVNVTPPVRQNSTLVALTVGDTIQFQIEGSIALGSVDLLGSFEDSSFSIYQIR
ncbi:MAG: hypothetical protein K8F54_04460 [Altibacter sp.]|uniref:C1q-like domain-containing protein n=1 Tax=Altibacter sp. TaxID=2024823 RepID=UPI001DF06D6C|nr:hypothetical protein [Altibacter sp.]MBZ0326832.1 hypothetical protein [Altibacter sp.]